MNDMNHWAVAGIALLILFGSFAVINFLRDVIGSVFGGLSQQDKERLRLERASHDQWMAEHGRSKPVAGQNRTAQQLAQQQALDAETHRLQAWEQYYKNQR